MFKKEQTSRKTKGIINIIKFLIIFNIIMFPVIFTSPAKAYERPEFNDGIAEGWHPGNYCVPCHYTVAGTTKAKEIDSNCDNCHKYRPKGTQFNTREIDKAKIINIHANIVCIRCHVGLKSQANITASDFHRVMSKTACLSCHTFKNGTYIKPLKTKCSDCHGGDPHIAHGKKLEKLCVACHGDFGEKYVNKSIGASDKMRPLSLSNNSAPDKAESPTLGQLIINLLGQLTQILR